MSGTKIGNRKVAKIVKRKYGKEWRQKIGRMGGQASTTGGFHYMKLHDPARFKQVSTKGGQNRHSIKSKEIERNLN